MKMYPKRTGQTAFVEWLNEDELPEMDDATFQAAYKASRVLDGVRMYPVVRIDGVRHLAIIVGDVSDDFREDEEPEPHFGDSSDLD